VTEQVLAAFVAHLYTEKLAANTVKNYLAAVRHAQISLGMGDPQMGNMPRLEYVVKGLKRRVMPAQNRQRLPITPEILGQLKRVWQVGTDRRDMAMLWAAATMCFFGFLRLGEVVVPSDTGFDSSRHLTYTDVKVDSQAAPRYLEVRIKVSKTDPFRKGVSVFLGWTGGELCPVAAVLDYMVRRGPGDGPLFSFSDGRPLTRERFVTALRKALDQAGLNAAVYAGHSFRIGAATTAARKGIQDSLIKTLGRWESAAYTVYIRTPRETLCGVARSLTQ
jgi:hypothetical protein